MTPLLVRSRCTVSLFVLIKFYHLIKKYKSIPHQYMTFTATIIECTYTTTLKYPPSPSKHSLSSA